MLRPALYIKLETHSFTGFDVFLLIKKKDQKVDSIM